MKLLLLCLLLNQNIHFQKENVKIIYVPYYERLTNDEIIKKLEITKEYDKFEFNIFADSQGMLKQDYDLFLRVTEETNKIFEKITVYNKIKEVIKKKVKKLGKHYINLKIEN